MNRNERKDLINYYMKECERLWKKINKGDALNFFEFTEKHNKRVYQGKSVEAWRMKHELLSRFRIYASIRRLKGEGGYGKRMYGLFVKGSEYHNAQLGVLANETQFI